MFRRSPLSTAIAALRRELAGGPPAELDREVRELAELLTAREFRLWAAHRDPAERELLAAMPDAAALVGTDGRIRVSNAALDGFAESGRATGLTLLELTHSAELVEGVRRAFEGSPRRQEVTLGRKTFHATIAPLLRGEVLLVLRDVTDAKQLEATRRDFVANASHELRTPITAIRAAAETLHSGAVEDPAEARRFLDIIVRHAERLARLSRDLLDLSRIETRQWPIAPSPIVLAPLVRQVLEAYEAPARDKGLALGSEVPDGLVVQADARALEHVLVNLVENAVKYTAAGSVTVRAAAGGGAVVITVVDTGPGIDRRHLPRLFERFYRVDPGRSREQGGTGLGLAIVKHLVQSMGGEVGVESGAEGSRFWVRLPAEP